MTSTKKRKTGRLRNLRAKVTAINEKLAIWLHISRTAESDVSVQLLTSSKKKKELNWVCMSLFTIRQKTQHTSTPCDSNPALVRQLWLKRLHNGGVSELRGYYAGIWTFCSPRWTTAQRRAFSRPSRGRLCFVLKILRSPLTRCCWAGSQKHPIKGHFQTQLWGGSGTVRKPKHINNEKMKINCKQ